MGIPKTVLVVIDVFRAFTTAAYVLEQNPKEYFFTNKSYVVQTLKNHFNESVLIGKPEIGFSLEYTIPNSPTRAAELSLKNKVIIHRTEAGGSGVVNAKNADIIIVLTFPTLKATVRYLKRLKDPKIIIHPMGHEAKKPSLEDDLCKEALEKELKGEIFIIKLFEEILKKGPGSYFFTKNQREYPEEDFKKCLGEKSFDFVIKAKLFDGYAILFKERA